MKNACERSFERLRHLIVADLSTAEQFVVGVSRCWDAFLADPDPTLAWRELAPVFAYMDVLGALCAFDAVFQLIGQHRLGALTFRDVDSEQLGSSEARLLCVLACLQRGDIRAAITALTGALSWHGIRALLGPLARIAALLDMKGHRLPAWRDGPLHGSADQGRHAPTLSDGRHPPSPAF